MMHSDNSNNSNQSSKKAAISLPLLLLDFFGTACIALGLAEITDVFHIVPERFQFEHYAVALIAVGFLLMIPFAFDIIKQTRQS